MPTPDAPVSAYVRIRPLVDKEISAQDTEMPLADIYLHSFTGVLDPAKSNADCFESCLAPKLPMVLSGGSVSLFSYGYTGGGKTHTIVGYGEERGFYFLASERLLVQLTAAPQRDEADRPLLKVTACEIYDDKVFDLLGPHKVECSLRVDDHGQLQVVGSATTEQLEGASQAVTEGGKLSTLVTRTTGLRTVSVRTPGHLQQIATSCVAQRAVGSSTEHVQSSRSHMLLQMEVVTPNVLAARERLDDAKATAPALRNDLENAGAVGLADCFSEAEWTASGPRNCKDVVRLLRGTSLGAVACTTASPLGDEMTWYEDAEGDLEVDRSVAPGQQPMAFALKGRGDEQRTIEGWASVLGATCGVCDYFASPLVANSLVRLPVVTRTAFSDAGEWTRRFEAHEVRKAELRAKLENNTAEVAAAKSAVANAQARGGTAVGGMLLLADLAGADYDHRPGAVQKESASINKSLLALKECLRCLAANGSSTKGSSKSARPKFRDTKLTRMLEDALAPNAASERRNKESASVMLVNVSPAASLEQPTLNAMRYGQLFTSVDGAAKVSSTTTAARRPAADKPWLKKKPPTHGADTRADS